MRCTVATSDAPSSSMFERSDARLGAADSTNVACAAPRESASSPSAPEPEKRSRTAGIGQIVLQNAHPRLAHAVRSGSHGGAAWGGDRSSAPSPGDDAHPC